MRAVLHLCILFATAAAWAAPVAQVAETRGAVSVVKATGKRLIVSAGSTLEAGDVVVTEENSTAALAFTDGGKVALRPNTRFGINAYNFAPLEPKADKGFFGLLAGGLRTLTGAIGKRVDRGAYRMQGATATIGIRGTEYTARLCKGDCGAVAPPRQKSAPAARLAGLKGSVTATSANGTRRVLSEGAALAAGELVETGEASWAGIAFNDDTRLVLRANSALRIDAYRFQAAAPAQDSFVTELLKGALRAVTGRMGKRNPSQVNFKSVTATIGIRGTRFDAWCVAKGSYGKDRPGKAGATTKCDQALLASVGEGGIAMGNEAGTAEAGAGQAAYVDGPGAAPGLLGAPVELPADDGAPSPEALPLFDAVPAPAGSGEGMYVLVHEGRITLTQDGVTVELGSGDSAFAGADGGAPELLEVTPPFLSGDPFLRSVNFDSMSCTLP